MSCDVQYYKGLGTSTAAEAKEYFSDLTTHRLEFEWRGDEDGDLIEMAFAKKRVDDRKEWLRSFEHGTHVDYKVRQRLENGMVEVSTINTLSPHR